jgi:hypothetical protein
MRCGCLPVQVSTRHTLLQVDAVWIRMVVAFQMAVAHCFRAPRCCDRWEVVRLSKQVSCGARSLMSGPVLLGLYLPASFRER